MINLYIKGSKINTRKTGMILIICKCEKYSLAKACKLDSVMSFEFVSGFTSLLVEKSYYQKFHKWNKKLTSSPDIAVLYISMSWKIFPYLLPNIDNLVN